MAGGRWPAIYNNLQNIDYCTENFSHLGNSTLVCRPSAHAARAHVRAPGSAAGLALTAVARACACRNQVPQGLHAGPLPSLSALLPSSSGAVLRMPPHATCTGHCVTLFREELAAGSRGAGRRAQRERGGGRGRQRCFMKGDQLTRWSPCERCSAAGCEGWSEVRGERAGRGGLRRVLERHQRRRLLPLPAPPPPRTPPSAP